MPFIINHIDNVLLAVEIGVKVGKFLVEVAKVLAKVAHFTALFIGGMLIISANWAYECYQHVEGKTTTYAAVEEADHGEIQHEEFAVEHETPEEYIASTIIANPIDWELEAENQMNEPLVELTHPVLAKDWVLDTDAIATLPIKPKRGGRVKAPREKVVA